ncbi:MAG: o-succinylbenzoate--CoA ligase, partial [Rhodothermales bacterium]|nr:o-succinylbenzoate--CoA ligase [Rhodothermales bacterium]
GVGAGRARRLDPAALLADAPAEAASSEGPFDAAQPATLVFTSGSTSAPKAALHTAGNHVFSARGSNANLPLGPGDRWLLSLPLYHVGGLAIGFRCFEAGAAVVLPLPGRSVGETITAYAVTHGSLVPTQLRRLLDEDRALPSLRGLLLGGAAAPAGLVEAAHARGLPVHTTYGSTEMASQVTTTPPGADLAALRTSGRLRPHRELRIAADGEILVRGATLFAGYVEGEGVRRPLDGAGWFHTGDLGRLDGEGFLHVLGRKDNLFVSGGENVQPEEVERALTGIDGVAQAVVVPVADAEWGARPVAFVRPAKGAALEPARLRAALAEHLPRFKIPDAFYPWPEDDGRMKPDRAALQRRAALHRG